MLELIRMHLLLISIPIVAGLITWYVRILQKAIDNYME
jgi:hypothetical protein